MLKRLSALIMLFCLLLAAPARAKTAYREIPAALRFTQQTETQQLPRDRYISVTKPQTAHPAVNAAMAGLIDGMAEEGKAFLPASGLNTMRSYLDVGSTVTRCGTRWMSFLTIARVADRRKQTYCAFDARVYNMETGRQIPLTDVIREDAWDALREEARAQLTAAYPQWEADEAALASLLADESLRKLPFTLTPGHLSLHIAAQELYPGADPSLLHVDVYRPALKALLTDTALAETDVSQYRLIALTYDDGVVRATTGSLMNVLRTYGAQGTFFVLGDRIEGNSDILHRGYDAGHSEQSHNWTHVYTGLTPDRIHEWKLLVDEAMAEAIGIIPVMMRAPGGAHEKFANAGIGLPVIGWSATASDAVADESQRRDVNARAARVTGSAHDGVIVLMHDINEVCDQYTRVILEHLTAENYLCVTVQDLFAARDLTLEPNVIYASGQKE